MPEEQPRWTDEQKSTFNKKILWLLLLDSPPPSLTDSRKIEAESAGYLEARAVEYWKANSK
jgi:hypothetical protein